jgi:Domain of unknown function (DUF4252)
MKFIKYTIKMLVPMLLLVFAMTANAQNARLNFDRLNGLETKATDVIEVNIDGKMLAMAKRVMTKVNDKDAKKIGEAIKGLEGIYVRVYNFAGENEYNLSDIDEIRTQLNNPSWIKIANVRSKKKNQKIDVYTMFEGDNVSGLAVVMSESKSIVLVNVIGPIDLDSLAELSGKLNIPTIGIEKETEEKPKP